MNFTVNDKMFAPSYVQKKSELTITPQYQYSSLKAEASSAVPPSIANEQESFSIWMLTGLTVQIDFSIRSWMDNSLDRGNSGYPFVKHVESSKIPASQPQKNVISTGKDPK